KRVAVTAQCMRHEAVIARIANRRVQETVNEQRARGLVDFILDQLAACRHFDDEVEVVWRVLAGGYGVDVHLAWALMQRGRQQTACVVPKPSHKRNPVCRHVAYASLSQPRADTRMESRSVPAGLADLVAQNGAVAAGNA